MISNPSLDHAVNVVKQHTARINPKIGLILGSGLGVLTEEITQAVAIPYDALGFTTSKVKGHASTLVLGYLKGIPVACMKGRLHLYEGIPLEMIKGLVRLLKLIGCHTLIVTGAVGSLRHQMKPGELLTITDHINMMPLNPLVGPNDESFGPRFVPMNDAYNVELRRLLKASAARIAIPLHEGVYLSTLGPNFETPVEIKAFSTLGADVVGMAVVPEVIVGRHCGMSVAGLAVITNYASGLSNETITHEGTLHHADRAARVFTKLIMDFIPTIPL